MPVKFIRIVDVEDRDEATCVVSCYHGDNELRIEWPVQETGRPAAGEVWEGDPLEPRLLNKVSAPSEPFDTLGDALRWRRPVCNKGISRMEILRRRHIIRQAVRAYLDGEGFLEIDAPLMVRGTTPDPEISSFAPGDRYLSTSTEYQMKRLAVGGFEKIYSLTQNFREGDTGPVRNPEFTMLEWGRVGGLLTDIENDAESFIRRALEALGGGPEISYQGGNIDMRGPWQRQSVAEAIERSTGVDVSSYSTESCRRALEAAGEKIQPQWAGDRDFLFSLLTVHIQPSLGRSRPVFLYDWPAFQTSSADVKEGTILVDRSELYIAGIELSDGFAGLADLQIQEDLFDAALEARAAMNKTAVEIDAAYLKAMGQGAPYGAGMALGFDRLVMLLTDQEDIKNVLAFGWEEL